MSSCSKWSKRTFAIALPEAASAVKISAIYSNSGLATSRNHYIVKFMRLQRIHQSVSVIIKFGKSSSILKKDQEKQGEGKR